MSEDLYALPEWDLPQGILNAAQLQNFLGTTNVLMLPRVPLGRPGLCYWNVLSYANSRPGRLELGWMLEYVPGLYVSAMHHGVWVSPSGEALDVTAPTSERPGPGLTVFARDNSIQIDLKWPPLITAKHFLLTEDDDVRKMLETYYELAKLRRENYEVLKIDPQFSWHPETGPKFDPPRPSFQPQNYQNMERLSLANDHYRRIVHQRYFPDNRV